MCKPDISIYLLVLVYFDSCLMSQFGPLRTNNNETSGFYFHLWIKGDVVRFNSGENVPVQVETRTSVQQEDEELGVGKLTGDVSEIVIPTASYRMGVPHMGLGLVSVTSQGDVFYTNLWLPSRYKIVSNT